MIAYSNEIFIVEDGASCLLYNKIATWFHSSDSLHESSSSFHLPRKFQLIFQFKVANRLIVLDVDTMFCV